jgi:Leucine-rich repeat (LRR) protein
VIVLYIQHSRRTIIPAKEILYIMENCDLAKEYENVVEELDEMETKLRIQHKPHLVERPPPLEADDLKEKNISSTINDQQNEDSNTIAVISDDGASASLRRRNLKVFTLEMFLVPSASPLFLSKLIMLDLSNNELMDLPGLGKMPNIETLNLERNWFNTLPKRDWTADEIKNTQCSQKFP